MGGLKGRQGRELPLEGLVEVVGGTQTHTKTEPPRASASRLQIIGAGPIIGLR